MGLSVKRNRIFTYLLVKYLFIIKMKKETSQERIPTVETPPEPMINVSVTSYRIKQNHLTPARCNEKSTASRL